MTEQDHRYRDHIRAIASAQLSAAEERFVVLLDSERRLNIVKQAIAAYLSALERRENGDLAAFRALDSIQAALEMTWSGKA